MTSPKVSHFRGFTVYSLQCSKSVGYNLSEGRLLVLDCHVCIVALNFVSLFCLIAMLISCHSVAAICYIKLLYKFKVVEAMKAVKFTTYNRKKFNAMVRKSI